jgi:tetratricopeptide (TPR) repeat protein
MGLCLALWAGAALAASPFEEGNRLFTEGKFAEAEVAYNRQLAAEGNSVAVRFNLGRVREALGDPGGAMLEWERALRLDAQHAPSLEALSKARTALGVRAPATRWWLLPRPEWSRGWEGWVLALGGWLSLLALGLAVFAHSRAGAAFLLGSGLCLSVAGGGWIRHDALEADMALVRARSVTVRGAPADPARSLGDLPAGSRVRILDHSAGWDRCALPEGGEGWIPEKALERIAPPH